MFYQRVSKYIRLFIFVPLAAPKKHYVIARVDVAVVPVVLAAITLKF